jgi:hypothetical protein
MEVGMAKLMSKTALIQKIAEEHPNNLTRKDVKSVIESLAEIGYKGTQENGRVLRTGIRQIRRHKETGHKGAERHQSLHKGANGFQGEAGTEDY